MAGPPAAGRRRRSMMKMMRPAEIEVEPIRSLPIAIAIIMIVASVMNAPVLIGFDGGAQFFIQSLQLFIARVVL